jgi:tRNA dimethylallyltransferase
MQVYRGMDIGTAKPSEAERSAVPHHLIDIADPSEDFSVSRFQAAGRAALDSVRDRGRTAVVAGGTGLHFRSVFPPTDLAMRGQLEAEDPAELRTRLLAMDPDAAAYVDMANPRRVIRAIEVAQLTGMTPSARAATPEVEAVRAYAASTPFVGIGVDPGGDLRGRIVERFDAMLASGLVAEVEALEPTMGRVARQAVGYKELIEVLHGRATPAEGRAAAISATVALAKRQRTFFRRDPRIQWLDPEMDASAAFARACEIIAQHDRAEA